MPDLSDKVSELLPCPMCGASAKKVGPDPRGMIYCQCVDCGVRGPWLYMGHGGTSEEAIAAWNRRTPPAASTKEGWRTMDSVPKEIGVLELGEDGSVKTTLRPEEFTSAIIAAGTYTIYAAPIPPEVMK